MGVTEFEPAVRQQVTRLGGEIISRPEGQIRLSAIAFPQPLVRNDFLSYVPDDEFPNWKTVAATLKNQPPAHQRRAGLAHIHGEKSSRPFHWQPQLFTPFRVETDDYREWHADLSNAPGWRVITAVTGEKPQDLVLLAFAQGWYPDHYYCSPSAPPLLIQSFSGLTTNSFFWPSKTKASCRSSWRSLVTTTTSSPNCYHSLNHMSGDAGNIVTSPALIAQ